MTHFNISIVSDTVCPWCYVGHRRLQVAIRQHLANHPGDFFAVQWHPFQLAPLSPKRQSVDKAASYASRLGTEQANLVFERLRSAARDTGIEFRFGGRTGNTLDSHRLLEFARREQADDKSNISSEEVTTMGSLQTRVAEELFADYFEREQDITDLDVLTRAAGRAGMDEKEVKSFLEGDELAELVEKEAQSARDATNGVPHFTINDTFEVEGAQEPRAFLMLFERLKKNESKL